MEEIPIPKQKPEAPPLRLRLPWLVPVLGLLVILVLWILGDTLLFQRSETIFSSRTILSYSQKRARLNSELYQLGSEVNLGHITVEQAQARLDSIIHKYHVPQKDEAVDGVQAMIQEKRKLEGQAPDSTQQRSEWPLILSLPSPKKDR
jgi:hypothetical protein